MSGNASKRTNGVQLSRSQTKVFADALEPLVAAFPSRVAAAKEFELKGHVIQAILERRAATNLSRDVFSRLATRLGINTTGWDVSREDIL